MAGGGDCGGSTSGDNASSLVGGGTVVGGRTEPWSRVRDSWFFPEVMRHGEPDMHPEFGRIVLARTAGMAELEESFRGHASFSARTKSPWPPLLLLESQLDVEMRSQLVPRCFLQNITTWSPARASHMTTNGATSAFSWLT